MLAEPAGEEKIEVANFWDNRRGLRRQGCNFFFQFFQDDI
jgi:hypothetical protein